MVIGVNFRTAPVEIRERFWISESRRYEALVDLSSSTGIEEVMVLATCNRTEFIVWTRDASAAANSILKFLTAQYGLRLCEWKHFYRLLEEAALVHFFQVASSLDSMIIGEPEIVACERCVGAGRESRDYEKIPGFGSAIIAFSFEARSYGDSDRAVRGFASLRGGGTGEADLWHTR
jgi:glutamyl-tRNA reductase